MAGDAIVLGVDRAGTLRRRRARALGILAVAAVVVVLAELVAALLMWAGLGFGDLPLSMVSGEASVVGGGILVLAYTTMGGLLAVRRPCSVVGWLFMLAGLSEVTTLLASMLAAQAEQVIRPVPGPTLALAWLTSSWSLPVLAASLTVVLVLFPDGRPLSRRWGLAALPGPLGAILIGLACSLDPRGLLWFPALPNPLGGTPLAGFSAGLSLIGLVVSVAGVLLGLAALVVRHRRGDAVLHAQLRWMVAAALLLVVAGVPVLVLRYGVQGSGLQDGPVLAAFAAGAFIPIAAAIAILRHHLYGMQVLVDRTLVYIPLMALSAGLYAGSVALFQRMFVEFTGDTSDVAIILSSLLLASVFTPLRRVLETYVERLFHAPAVTTRPTEKAGVDEPDRRLASLEARIRRLEAEDHQRAAMGRLGRRSSRPPRPLHDTVGRHRAGGAREAMAEAATSGG